MRKIFTVLALLMALTVHTTADDEVISLAPPFSPMPEKPVRTYQYVDSTIDGPQYAEPAVIEPEKHVVPDAIVTAYCSCPKCCGQWSAEYNGGVAVTSTGAVAKAGRTVAVNPAVIPYGAHVWINGHEYIAEDTGSTLKKSGTRIDIYCDSHEEALRIGRSVREIIWRN